MGDAKEQITKAAEHLKQQRDELRVKLQIGQQRLNDWCRIFLPARPPQVDFRNCPHSVT